MRRLDALPEVSRTVTLNSFVPGQQKEKLALIGNAAMLLKPILDVAPLAPPSDQALQHSLATTAASLRQAATGTTDSAAGSARRLADVLERLQSAAPEVRAAAASAVVNPLRVMLDQTRALLQAGPVTLETLPRDLVADWTAKDGRARLQVLPRDNHGDNASLRHFAEAIQKIAPDATGRPISISASGDTVVEAFLQAGAYSILAITLLLAVVLRRARDVILTMLPVLLSGLLTFATCAALDLPLNFTNIIALPLLFGIGVAFNIYFVLAWRAGETGMLQSSLMRAVVFSALTTATAFGALWLSSHPGTASMGRLLMISLGWELARHGAVPAGPAGAATGENGYGVAAGPKTKKVRQTEVAGPVHQLRLSSPRKAGASYWLYGLCSKGGFRWGHEGTHTEAERRSVRGAKVNFGLRPFLFTASSS